MESSHGSAAWRQFGAGLTAIARWVAEHEEELRALEVWGSVGHAARKARLYAPVDAEAWRQLHESSFRDPSPDYEALIVSLYGPAGVGFDSLRHELVGAPLLADRQSEVTEVLDSLFDARNYVTVCGALPLIEYVLGKAAGRWKQPTRHNLSARLDEVRAFSPDEEAVLLVNSSAVYMVLNEVPEVWKAGRQQIDTMTGSLNRHFVLHGTGLGWDDATNATRAVLLLAAAARVAGPLLSPSSDVD